MRCGEDRDRSWSVVSRWADHGLARDEHRVQPRFVIRRVAAADAGEELLSRAASGTNSALGLAWDAGCMGSDYEFEQFVRTTEPGLRRALTGHLAREAVADALAEAFAYAWEHWDRVMHLEHPTGYLFRVAQSKVRIRKQGFLPWSSRGRDARCRTRPRRRARGLVAGAVPSRVAGARLRLDVCGDRRSAPHVAFHGGISREPGARTPTRTTGSWGRWVSSKTGWSVSLSIAPRRSRRSRCRRRMNSPSAEASRVAIGWSSPSRRVWWSHW